MDTLLLFRKRSPLTDDRLPWSRDSGKHTWTAWRNTSGKGEGSAILARALLSALDGSLLMKCNAGGAPSARLLLSLQLVLTGKFDSCGGVFSKFRRRKHP